MSRFSLSGVYMIDILMESTSEIRMSAVFEMQTNGKMYDYHFCESNAREQFGSCQARARHCIGRAGGTLDRRSAS
jgi:uncharacterized protein YjlB